MDDKERKTNDLDIDTEKSPSEDLSQIDLTISDEIEPGDSDEEINETEIPIHLNKKNKKRTPKKKKRKKKNTIKKKRKSLFELMSATSEDGYFKPLVIFGHTIKFWPLIVLVIIIACIVMLFINNGQVQVLNQNVSVVGLSEDIENYKILVLSDLNAKRFGDEQSLLLRSINSADYKIIICVGDMVGESGDPQPFYEFLEGISRPSRVYFTCGDSDPGPYVSTPRAVTGTLREIVLEDWILGAIERGANYVDVPTQIKVGESNIWLSPTSYLNTEATQFRADWKDQMEQEEDGAVTGLESDYNSLPITSYRYLLAKKFFTACNSIRSTDLLIGLSHIVPDDDYIISAASHDGDEGVYMPEPELIISGHYCGGVWKIPILDRAFYVPNRMLPRYGWLPDPEDVEGLSRIGESQVYISPGLSTTASMKLLPFRLANGPKMTVLSFTASLPASMLDQ